MCHCYLHFIDEVTGIQGHSVIKGTLKIQTQGVWLGLSNSDPCWTTERVNN